MATQAAAKASEQPLRRVPVQGRSVARVARMLDTCAEILDEVGYDGLTTTQLAERAGVAIGSVYQFFPDKRAVVQALTMRNLEAYLARVTLRLSGSDLSDWREAVGAAVDEYFAMHRSVPGFRTLQFANIIDRQSLEATGRDNSEVIAEHLAELLSQQWAVPMTAAARFSLVIAMEITDALARAAFRRDPEGDPAVIGECKTVVREYLDVRLGSH